MTKLEERYGSKKLEEACGEVLRHSSSPSIRRISTVIESAVNKKNAGDGKTTIPHHSNAHGITQGAAYYSRDRRNGKNGEGKRSVNLRLNC